MNFSFLVGERRIFSPRRRNNWRVRGEHVTRFGAHTFVMTYLIHTAHNDVTNEPDGCSRFYKFINVLCLWQAFSCLIIYLKKGFFFILVFRKCYVLPRVQCCTYEWLLDEPWEYANFGVWNPFLFSSKYKINISHFRCSISTWESLDYYPTSSYKFK